MYKLNKNKAAKERERARENYFAYKYSLLSYFTRSRTWCMAFVWLWFKWSSSSSGNRANKHICRFVDRKKKIKTPWNVEHTQYNNNNKNVNGWLRSRSSRVLFSIFIVCAALSYNNLITSADCWQGVSEKTLAHIHTHANIHWTTEQCWPRNWVRLFFVNRNNHDTNTNNSLSKSIFNVIKSKTLNFSIHSLHS